MLGVNTNTIKSTEALLEFIREVGVEVNTGRTKYMVMSGHQSAGKIDLVVSNKSFENVAKFSNLGTSNKRKLHSRRK
jgi:hypothetical protein